VKQSVGHAGFAETSVKSLRTFLIVDCSRSKPAFTQWSHTDI
jgi:hypothetical protein